MIYLFNNITILLYWHCFKKIKYINHRKIFLFFCLVQMTLIIGLRDGVGADFYSYQNIYDYFCGKSVLNLEYNDIEVGYKFLNKVFGKLGAPYWGINMFVGFLTNLFLVKAVEEFKVDACQAVFMYISLFFFFHSMNQVRQGLAMTIGLYAVSQLTKNRNAKFLIWTMFAMLFHTVAIVYFPLIFLREIEVRRKTLVLYIFATFFAIGGYSVVIAILLKTKYGIYFDSFYDQHATLTTILNLIVRIVLLMWSMRYSNYIKDGRLKNILYHMIIICTCFQIMTVQSSLFGRVTTPFFMAYIILLPLIITNMSYKRPIIVPLGFMGAGFYQLVYYFAMKTAVLCNDYKSILSK